MITSVEDYYRRTTRVESENIFAFFYTKRMERETTEFYRRFYQDYYNLVVRLKQIGWYTLSTSVFPYPKLTPAAERAFANLPSTFDVKQINIWKDFFSSYGTHLVISSQMGGQVWAESWYEKCLTYEHTEVWIHEQVEQTFLLVFGSKSETNEHQLVVDKRFKEFSIYSSQVLGGDESIPAEKLDEWLPTVKSDPRPISHRLMPLYQLLPKGNQRTALQAAIEYIANEAQAEDRAYITSLQSIRGPEPTKCSRNRVRRALINSTQSPQINYTDIRNALCPYVGYSGETCVGATGRQAYLPVYRRVSDSTISIFFIFDFLG